MTPYHFIRSIGNMRRGMLLSLLILPALIVYGAEFTVVIDAGHGGKDYGAVGKTAREKDINLSVALKVGELIKNNMKDTRVVYTRDNDTFVTLQGRADLANKANGDLFVSIHTNSVDAKSPRRNVVNGASVYTLGLKRSEENFNVAKRENAVMMLEKDYTTTYSGFDPNSTESYIMFELSRDIHMDHSIKAADAIQSELVATAGRKDNGVRQAIFWVLVQTSMPAVLVELDFICNPTSEQYLNSRQGQKKLAQAIYNGIKSYKAACDKEADAIGNPSKKKGENAKPSQPDNSNASGEKSASKTKQKDKTPDKQSDKNEAPDAIIYKVQFMTSPRQLPDNSPKFKGLTPNEHYTEKGIVKYTYGSTTSAEEAQKILRKVKEKFSDAFIIKTKDNQRIK